MKKKLLISFSGGRTSGYMLWWLMNEWEDRDNWEMIVVFANTGKEVEGTLEFIERCSVEWGIEIIWVESVPATLKGWGVTFRHVDFITASRNGEPFEEMISHLGLPCSETPFCSDQLKRCVIESYLKSIGWKDYYKAIGLRADEIDRVRDTYKEKKIFYPLIKDNPVNKKMVIDWWANQSFNLDIPNGFGNCDNCWKKSAKILTSNAKKYPLSFEWWQKMTDKYGQKFIKNSNEIIDTNFYRGGKSPKDIFKLAELEERQLDLFAEHEKLDGCSETCEAF